MTVVEKNCDNCDRDRNGDEVHPTVILPKKGAIHPFVEVYRPLEQPRSVGLLIIFQIIGFPVSLGLYHISSFSSSGILSL